MSVVPLRLAVDRLQENSRILVTPQQSETALHAREIDEVAERPMGAELTRFAAFVASDGVLRALWRGSSARAASHQFRG